MEQSAGDGAATFSRARVLKTNDARALRRGKRWKNANFCLRTVRDWRTALTGIKDGWVPVKPRFPFLCQHLSIVWERTTPAFFPFLFSHFFHDNAVGNGDIPAGCHDDKSQ
ncbi:hypothetical protein K0M31_006394, partial [Melipona bicolor]